MINILINESDNYYFEGMSSLLRNLFFNNFNRKVIVKKEMTLDNIWNADLIFLPLLKGEVHTCKPELRYRKHAIIIGLIDYDSNRRQKTPLCYRDIILLNRKSSPKKMCSEINFAWNNKMNFSYYLPKSSCVDCQHKVLSERENIIAQNLMAGVSTHIIARKLNISEKTVYAHTYIMMKKFNISSKKDLFSLLIHLRGCNK